MKEFFLANLVLLFKNGAALIFANFFGILVVSFQYSHSAAAADS
jgi:hypothetical protein